MSKCHIVGLTCQGSLNVVLKNRNVQSLSLAEGSISSSGLIEKKNLSETTRHRALMFGM